ncbi:hypothetical protein [Xylanivirga thermophila]|jgi:hypothetical protein|uniref:hypothetical protein n=1 Tax=Xylanivirga thermophila TaxID=2496273 RepID=UPI00101DAC7E|nr:hypothetical protein [Xylanivirga thermophila]
MEKEMERTLSNIESHIERCHILSEILKDRIHEQNIDYMQYLDQGYTMEDISAGADIIDLYITIKNMASKVKV